MGLLTGIFGLENHEETIKELATEKVDRVSSVPVTAPNPGDDSIRVPAEELENGYVADPIVFNSINKNVQTIMGAGYELDCEGNDKIKILKYFNTLLGNIGITGGDETFDEILECAFQNAMIYGKQYIENVFNKNDTQITDLVSLDPKAMDYARNSNNKVLLDRVGKPVGYTQTLPYGVDIEGLGDTAPESVSLKPQQIFVLPERIALIKLYTYGDKLFPLGLIEPGYKSLIRKQNIEEAQANSIYARGTYPIIDYVGTPERFPTPKMLQNATEKLSKMQHNRYFAFPYWHRIEPLEVKQSEIVDDTIKTLRENVSAALGMPLAFATGSGEATNRATLATQQKFLEFSLNDIAKRVASSFRKTIFARIAKLKKFSDVPFLVWGDIGAENKDDKAKRLTDYTKVGILEPQEVKEYALKSEELLLGKSNEEKEIIKEKVDVKKENKLVKEKVNSATNLNKEIENQGNTILKDYSIKINRKIMEKEKVEEELGGIMEELLSKKSVLKTNEKLKEALKEELMETNLELELAKNKLKQEKEIIIREKESLKKELNLEKEHFKKELELIKKEKTLKDVKIPTQIKIENLERVNEKLKQMEERLLKKIKEDRKEELNLKEKNIKKVFDFSYGDIRKILAEGI